MDARTAALAAVACLLTFVVLDALWLSLYAISAFQREVGPILRPDPLFWAVGIFYLIYAAALTVLIVVPGRLGSIAATIWKGALFGLAAYATFDLTNLATIKGWSVSLALKDMAWGTFCTAASAAAGHVVVSRRT